MVYVKSKWIYLNKESKAVLSGLTWNLPTLASPLDSI